MKSRTFGVAVAAIFVVSVFGPAASAENVVDTAIMPQGLARVGETLNCTKAGGVDPTGRGLQYPQTKDLPKHPAGGNEKDRKYRFVGFVQSVAKGTGFADICGNITKAGGFARCGQSKGYNGKGLIRYANGDIDKIDQLTWKLQTDFIVITAKVAKYNEFTDVKRKPGRLYGLTQWVPDNAAGQSCANGWNPQNADRNNKGDGARQFIVNALMWSAQEDDLPTWNDVTDNIDGKDGGKSTPDNPWGPKSKEKPKKPCHADCETGPING